MKVSAIKDYWYHGNLRVPPHSYVYPPRNSRQTHWFPLIRPAIRAGYFLGGVALGGYLRFP